MAATQSRLNRCGLAPLPYLGKRNRTRNIAAPTNVMAVKTAIHANFGCDPALSKPNLPTDCFQPVVDAVPGGHVGNAGEEEFVEADGEDQPAP